MQADEPFMPGTLVAQVASGLAEHPDCAVATLCEPIESEEMLFDPNAVKVVVSASGYALFFSRAPIPWRRDAFASGNRRPSDLHFRHIGLYAYHAAFVKEYVSWPASNLELEEALEQLRVLEAGRRIFVARAGSSPGPGVDTEADLDQARALARQKPAGKARKAQRVDG